MRLFIALHLSAPEAEDALCRAMEALRQHGSGRFTRPENLHLTLAFLGQCDGLRPAIRALQAIEAEPFSLSLDGHIGNFGDVYWAGLSPSVQLTALQHQVATCCQKEGFLLEERPFLPHITLCRRYRPGEGLDLSAAAACLQAPPCVIQEVSLMESSTINGVLTYRRRGRRALLER